MGDVGSLALGGALGVVAVLIKQEILLMFIGGVYVIEALSVILQVGSYKLRKKRIFKMAPIHHHFEALGWQESKIITRFWIAGLVMALFALTTLKLQMSGDVEAGWAQELWWWGWRVLAWRRCGCCASRARWFGRWMRSRWARSIGVTVEPQTDAAFRDAELVVISPGVPADLDVLAPVRARGVPVIGELELAAPFLEGQNIGVTGTNGKTTTTALTGQFCESPESRARWAAISARRRRRWLRRRGRINGTCWNFRAFNWRPSQTFRAPIAACLNVTQNHLDRHHTFENYVNAKARLFETQRPGRPRGAERRRSGHRRVSPDARRPRPSGSAAPTRSPAPGWMAT